MSKKTLHILLTCTEALKPTPDTVLVSLVSKIKTNKFMSYSWRLVDIFKVLKVCFNPI